MPEVANSSNADAQTLDAPTHDAETHDAETHDAETHDAETHDAETLLWGRNGLDGSCEALAAYRAGHHLVNPVATKTNANTEFALAA